MAELDKEMIAYEAMRATLEAHHMGKWAVIHDEKLVDVYESFELAAENAVLKFGSGPFLITQIGATPITLPASVMYNLV